MVSRSDESLDDLMGSCLENTKAQVSMPVKEFCSGTVSETMSCRLEHQLGSEWGIRLVTRMEAALALKKAFLLVMLIGD